MSVLTTDILYYLTGGVGNTDPNLSLGGTTSSTQVGSGLHNIFDYVSPTEAAAGDVEYRAITVKNNNIADTLYDAKVYISLETTSADSTIALAYDSGGSQSVVDESTAPSAPALTFTSPTSYSTGIGLGDMAPAATKRIWLRRTITAGAGIQANDNGSLTVSGATA